MVDLKDFLKHYIKEKKGNLENEKGEIIGWHDGVVFHTLGERHGFTITKKSPEDKPYYVIGKDVKKNILYVSQDKNALEKRMDISQEHFCLALTNTNWIKNIPSENKKYTAQIRYHGEFLSCRLSLNKTGAEVIFEKQILVASGQSIVIYDKDICLGGGVVE